MQETTAGWLHAKAVVGHRACWRICEKGLLSLNRNKRNLHDSSEFIYSGHTPLKLVHLIISSERVLSDDFLW
jgi:hypothetical protein